MTGESPRDIQERAALRFWDARAAHYDAHYDYCGPGGYSLRSRLALTLRLVGDGEGAALDVGMGAGRLCEALASRGWQISGVDASKRNGGARSCADPSCGVATRARGRGRAAVCERLLRRGHRNRRVGVRGCPAGARGDRACGETRRRRCRDYPNQRAPYSLWKDYVWHPLVRHLKRLLGRGAKSPPRDTVRGPGNGSRRSPAKPASRLESARFALPPPSGASRRDVPGLTERVGQRMDGSAGPSARLFGTQAVYPARPTASGEPSAVPAEKMK